MDIFVYFSWMTREDISKYLQNITIDSLWPSDAIWHRRYWSTLVQVMAPSHYLNQYWLSVNKVLWRSFQCNDYLNTQNINIQVLFEIFTFKIIATSPMGQWVNSPSTPSATYMRQWIGSALFQIMACCLFSAKPLSKPMLGYCQLDCSEETAVKF